MRALISYVFVLTGLRLLVCFALLGQTAIAADCPCKDQTFWKVEVSGFSPANSDDESPNGVRRETCNGKYVVGAVVVDDARWENWCGPAGGNIQKQARLVWWAEDSNPSASRAVKIPNGPGGVWVLDVSGDSSSVFYLLGAEWKCGEKNVMKVATPSGSGYFPPREAKAVVSPTSTDCQGRPISI